MEEGLSGCGFAIPDNKMASLDDFLHWRTSILKKDGGSSKVKKVRFNSSIPELNAGISGRCIIDDDDFMECKSYSKTKKKKKEKRLRSREAEHKGKKRSEERTETSKTITPYTPLEYEV